MSAPVRAKGADQQTRRSPRSARSPTALLQWSTAAASRRPSLCALYLYASDGVVRGGQGKRRFELSSVSDPREPVQASLGTLEPLVFQRVGKGKFSSLWNELIQRYHYLGYRPLSGAQMRYLIWSGDGRLLAAIGFGASAWQVKPRDQYIGWESPATRSRPASDRQQRPLLDFTLGEVLWASLADFVRNLYRNLLPCSQLDPTRTNSRSR